MLVLLLFPGILFVIGPGSKEMPFEAYTTQAITENVLLYFFSEDLDF
jgi:hypothetical protein